MRLLRRTPNGEFEVRLFDDDKVPPYAILSHTWIEGEEVTFQEVVQGAGKHKGGYDKIRFCVDRAAKDGLEYIWIDTCCINKSNSNAVELTSAINSMFRWYQGAARITWTNAFRRSRWFTRGWTLQELVAPGVLEFFSKEGRYLGSKVSLEQDIHEITRIPIDALRGRPLPQISVDERMRWAEGRSTSLKEDKVYCLLGIFSVFLPLIYGEGEEYATIRLRDEISRREGGGGTKNQEGLTVSTTLPFPRNDCFTGRETELHELKSLLQPSIHQRMTIYGLGGCGKSSLALEFAYRAFVQRARILIFWVPAMSPHSFENAYRDIGVRLAIPGIADDNADAKGLVCDMLSSDTAREYLLIVDNADDVDVLFWRDDSKPESRRLFDYLPTSVNTTILFTTRSRKAAVDLTQNKVLELTDMGEAEARQMLKRRITEQSRLNDKSAVDELLRLLTYLPLAIIQAAAFINKNDTPVSEYVAFLQDPSTETEVFSEHFIDPSRYGEMESTIAKTWHISFEQMRNQDPLAAEYLAFIACIDRVGIPKSLFPPGASQLQQAKALGTLKAYAFITEQQQTIQAPESEIFYDMHRLVHMASVWWLESHHVSGTWKAKAAERLQDLIPGDGDHETRRIWPAYLPHANYVAREDIALDEVFKASLLYRVGSCELELGHYHIAEVAYRRAHSLAQKTLGDDHVDTLKCMNSVGSALLFQGMFEQAEEIYRQTSARRERVLGHKHRDTLMCMDSLAFALVGQRKYEESERIIRKVLPLCQEVFGLENSIVLNATNTLAYMLGAQKKIKESETLLRQIVTATQKLWGPEYPFTLNAISNLAALLSHQCNFDEAELMQRQVLALRKRVLGLEHRDVLVSMCSLGVTLIRRNKRAEAEVLQRQLLELAEKVLGLGDKFTLACVAGLARNLVKQQRYEESESLFKRACADCHTVLGPDHPDTLHCYQGYYKCLALIAVRAGTLPLDAHTETRKWYHQLLAEKAVESGVLPLDAHSWTCDCYYWILAAQAVEAGALPSDAHVETRKWYHRILAERAVSEDGTPPEAHPETSQEYHIMLEGRAVDESALLFDAHPDTRQEHGGIVAQQAQASHGNTQLSKKRTRNQRRQNGLDSLEANETSIQSPKATSDYEGETAPKKARLSRAMVKTKTGSSSHH